MLIIFFISEWSVKHVDFTAAFLNDDIDRKLFIRFPSNVPSKKIDGAIYLLRKCTIWLKTSPLQTKWISHGKNRIQKYWIGLFCICRKGCSRYCINHPCFCRWSNPHLHHPTIQDRCIENFPSHFERIVEPLVLYLGVHISVQEEVMQLSKSAYVNQILNQFQLQDCRTYNTLMVVNFYDELSHHQDDPVINGHIYRNMIGSPKFIAHRTRLDISLAEGILSQYARKPTQFVLKSLHRTFGYLKATSQYGIQFNFTNRTSKISKFSCDSNFAGDEINWKSSSGRTEKFLDFLAFETRESRVTALYPFQNQNTSRFVTLHENSNGLDHICPR